MFRQFVDAIGNVFLARIYTDDTERVEISVLFHVLSTAKKLLFGSRVADEKYSAQVVLVARTM